METRSTLIFSFCISATAKVKPLLKSLDSNLQGATLIFFQKIRLVFRVGIKRNKTEIFFGAMPPPPFFKMSQDFVFSESCTRVHEFEEKTKFHVPGYMDLKKKQNSMYPVHESEKTKSWDILKKSGWGRLGAKKNFRFVSFFANSKK